VLAALGLVVSPRRRDVQRSVFLGGDALTAEAVAEVAAELGAVAREQLHEDDAELRAVYELRYRGQAFELAVEGPLEPEPAELRESFEALHEERYGYRDAQQELELVTLRVSAMIPGTDVDLGTDARDSRGNGNGNGHAETAGGDPEDTTRRATLDGEPIDLRVIVGSPPPGATITGPAVVELPESTLLVPPQWAGDVDQTGTIHLHSNAEAGDGPG
jgi:N-methylhydantoinase A